MDSLHKAQYLLAGVLVMLLAACGGSGGSSSSSGAYITGGIVVDPYIVGATFFEDVNGNGRWDAGEQISTPSDENGVFSFSDPVPAGRTIIMHDRGKHNGLIFTGIVARRIFSSDAGLVVVSPLTTLQAMGLSSSRIVQLLEGFIPDLNESHITADPYAPLAFLEEDTVISDESLAGIRANVLVGTLLQLYSPVSSRLGLSTQVLEGLISGDYFDFDQHQVIVDAVNHALHPDAMGRVRAELPPEIETLVTMRDVADTIPALTGWWLQKYLQILVEDRWDAVGIGVLIDQINAVQGQLGAHYFIKTNNMAGAYPDFSEGHVYLTATEEIEVTDNIVFTDDLFDSKALVAGDTLLLFDVDSPATGRLQMISGDGEDTEIIDAVWEIDANGDLLIGTVESIEAFARISLIANWPGHIHAQVQGLVAEEFGHVANLPLVKAQPLVEEELIGSHFIIDDGSWSDGMTGGRLSLYSGGMGDLLYYPESTVPVPITWEIDAYQGLVIDTLDGQVDTLYLFNPFGTNVMMLSDINGEKELEYDLDLYRPLLLEENDIIDRIFLAGTVRCIDSVCSEDAINYISNGSKTYESSDVFGDEEGTWQLSIDQLTLRMIPDAGEVVERHLWFVRQRENIRYLNVDDEVERRNEYKIFYEQYGVGGLSGTGFIRWYKTLPSAEN